MHSTKGYYAVKVCRLQ